MKPSNTIPFVLEYPHKYFKDINTKKDAIQKLIYAVAELYGSGITFQSISDENCKYYKAIENAREKIINKFNCKSLITTEKLIKYVYTRDEVSNPFGPWKEFNYFLPFSCLLIAIDIIYNKEKFKSKNPPILPIKLAGVIFSVYITTIRNKKNDEVIIREPNNLYQIANLDWRTFMKGTDLLSKYYQVKSLYHKEKVYKNNKTQYRYYTIRRINNYKRFLDEIIKNHYKYFSRISKKVKLYDTKLYISSGVNFHQYFDNFDDIKYVYETKYIRDGFSKFFHKAMDNNPFLRIYKTNNNYYIYSQYYLLNYLSLFYSLYTKQENDVNVFKFSELNYLLAYKFKLKNKQINRLLNYKHIDKSIKILKRELKSKKLLNEKRMISNLNEVENKGVHFEQILECIPYVNILNQEGIPINIRKAEMLLSSTSNNETDNNYNFETGKYNKKKLKAWLKDIISNSKDNWFKQNILTGYFKPHGAKTHRMTCHKLNLQGIPKKIKNEIFSPLTQDEIILSIDVSGQDIVVAANLAKKLYNDNFIKQYFYNQNELIELKEKIDKTLVKLSNPPTNRPTDYLKSIIKQHVKKNYDQFQYFINDEGEIKDLIKKCIYINFYGGTKNTFVRGLKEEQSSNTEFDEIDDSQFKISKEDIKAIVNRIKEILENQNIIIPDPSSQKYKEMAKLFYKAVIFSIKEEYPGILESLEIYNSYSKKNNNISYPTLLGWQTIIEDPLSFRGKDIFTKSKSYPIQASGAEFIRQWLIEANKINNGEFRIINVVHDQLLLLLNKSNIDSVKNLVQESLRTAASKIGIIPETINVNYEEYNYNVS